MTLMEITAGTNGRFYITEAGSVIEGPFSEDAAWCRLTDLDDPSQYDLEEQEALIKAEFGMSWIAGGGNASDVNLAWAQGIR